MNRLAVACSVLFLSVTASWMESSVAHGGSPIGDGVADDTEAVQTLIDGSGRLRVSTGTFRLTKTIHVDLDKTGFVGIEGGGVARFVMAGAGPAFRFVGTHKGTAAPDSFESRVWDRQRAPTVDGIEIVGDHPKAGGIEADGTMQLTLTRILIRKTVHAVRLVNRNRNVLISDSHIYENRGVGLLLDDVDLHQINVGNCHISYNAQGGIVSRKGNVRNLHITGCDIESNMSSGSPPTANIFIDCSDSQNGTAEVAITGCTIQHNSKSPDSANIRILGQAAPSPQLGNVRWGNVTITGNVMSDVAVNLHLRACRGVTIQGNTLWMGYAQNVLIEDCANVVMGSNNLDRNPSYAYGNAAEAINAVIFRNCSDCTISGLHVSNVQAEPAAVLFDGGRRLNVSGCSILDCGGVGMLFRNVSESVIGGCLVDTDKPTVENRPGFRMEGGFDNIILENRFAGGSRIEAESIRPKQP